MMTFILLSFPFFAPLKKKKREQKKIAVPTLAESAKIVSHQYLPQEFLLRICICLQDILESIWTCKLILYEN